MQVLIIFVRDAAPGMDGNLAQFRVSKEQTNLPWVIPLAWRVFISRSSFANQEKCNQNTSLKPCSWLHFTGTLNDCREWTNSCLHCVDKVSLPPFQSKRSFSWELYLGNQTVWTSTKRERERDLPWRLQLSGLMLWAAGSSVASLTIKERSGVPGLSFDVENPQRPGAAGRDRQFALPDEILSSWLRFCSFGLDFAFPAEVLPSLSSLRGIKDGHQGLSSQSCLSTGLAVPPFCSQRSKCFPICTALHPQQSKENASALQRAFFLLDSVL